MKVSFLILYFIFYVFSYNAVAQDFKDYFIGSKSPESRYRYDANTNGIILNSQGLKNTKVAEGYYFVFTKTVGDFRFSANIDLSENKNSKSRTGLMVRSSLDLNSAFGEIGVQDSSTTRVFRQQERTGYGGAKKRCLLYSNPDYFVLERKADTVFYKVSSGGAPLKLYGINIMSLSDTVLVGMYLKSNNDGQVNQAEFKNVRLEKFGSEN